MEQEIRVALKQQVTAVGDAREPAPAVDGG
jgi:hypothetical protein